MRARKEMAAEERHASALDGKLELCRVLRGATPPTPPGPEGSNGNGYVRAQWVTRYFFVFGVV